LTKSLRQGLAILLASCAVGLGGNALRREPLPYQDSLDPPPEPEAGTDLPAISPEDAHARWEGGAMFVDVRPREEWSQGRIMGASSVDAAGFPQSYFDTASSLDPAIPLVVYGAGPDSFAVRRVAAGLGEMGHGDVALVVCGLAGLEATGISTEKGESVP
jgi:rhodanese-related sulfurtransferase